MKDTIILGIESSCDETACAIVKNKKEVLSSVVASQIDVHKEFGGVVPEVASLSLIHIFPGMCVQIIAGQNIMDPSQDGVILYAEGDVVDTITTDKDGTAVSRLLPLGHYQVKEIEAPDGFVLNDESYDVELAYEGENKAVVLKSITIKNEKQDIRIKVLKHCGGEKLNGGSFGLYASQDIVSADGKLLLKADDLIETQKAIEGEIIFTSDLPLGSYYVYELEAPQGLSLIHI